MTTTQSPPGVPKLGLILPEGERDMDGRTARWLDYVEMAQTAEAMGFDSLWFVDHLLYGEGQSTEPPQGVWGARGQPSPDLSAAELGRRCARLRARAPRPWSRLRESLAQDRASISETPG